jgi:hypothetical protein
VHVHVGRLCGARPALRRGGVSKTHTRKMTPVVKQAIKLGLLNSKRLPNLRPERHPVDTFLVIDQQRCRRKTPSNHKDMKLSTARVILRWYLWENYFGIERTHYGKTAPYSVARPSPRNNDRRIQRVPDMQDLLIGAQQAACKRTNDHIRSNAYQALS